MHEAAFQRCCYRSATAPAGGHGDHLPPFPKHIEPDAHDAITVRRGALVAVGIEKVAANLAHRPALPDPVELVIVEHLAIDEDRVLQRADAA